MAAAVRLAAGRAADEAAAEVVGDRRPTARATGRAAPAARASAGERPSFVPAASSAPVPQPVAALPAVPRAPRRAAPWTAVLLGTCASVSAAASATGVAGLHHDVEAAQGEAGR
ncbi:MULTISPECIES: hypothetical protein [unclassified Streptomyces]|uniref:hypothetical protein n=1 Tax=unclassified Streptomyces TaxID=2593676 RepID=UPI0033B9DD16